jgi:hypothetical protein
MAIDKFFCMSLLTEGRQHETTSSCKRRSDSEAKQRVGTIKRPVRTLGCICTPTLPRTANSKDENATTELFSELPLSQQTQDGIPSSYKKLIGRTEESSFYYAYGHSAKGGACGVERKRCSRCCKNGQWKNSRLYYPCLFYSCSYLFQVLEILLRKQWTPYDGLGALIISPTRELVLTLERKANHRQFKYSKFFEK